MLRVYRPRGHRTVLTGVKRQRREGHHWLSLSSERCLKCTKTRKPLFYGTRVTNPCDDSGFGARAGIVIHRSVKGSGTECTCALFATSHVLYDDHCFTYYIYVYIIIIIYIIV